MAGPNDIQGKYDALVAHDKVIEAKQEELREAHKKRISMYEELRDTIGAGNSVEVKNGNEIVTLNCVHKPGFSEPVMYTASSGPTKSGRKLAFGDDVSYEKIRRKK